MAVFIPEKLGTAGAKAIHIKRELSNLDDAHVVRSPFPRKEWLPDFFIQHAENGWLALAVSDTSFASLSADQLFEEEKRQAFETLLEDFNAFSHIGALEGEKPLKKLVLMWKCTTQEAQQVSARFGQKHGIVFLSKDAFKAGGAPLVSRIVSPISERQTQLLLSSYFPEAEIHPGSTTRRLFRRDNSASLGKYFLDYNQEWAAKLDLSAPQEQTETSQDFALRLVNGVAGSGKTLIAISRALLLAEMHPDQKVLVMIHNTPVVADIKAKLMRTRGSLPENLEISTFYAWASAQWKRVHGGLHRICVYAHEVEALIGRCRSQWPELTPSNALLVEELDFINENLLENLEDYIKANRAGRGFALREKERSAVWALYETVTKHFASAAKQTMLWSAKPRDICLTKNHSKLEKVDHVLIDEAQFFRPSWFQAVRLSMRENGSLFLCADPNQGFLGSRLSWKSVGLEVAGRTKKLHRSYRTTQAILSAATQILQQHAKGDTDDYLQPDLAGMEPGVAPVFLQCASVQDTIEKLINEIRDALHAGALTPSDLLVIYGDHIDPFALYRQLGKAFGEDAVWWFNKSETKSKPPKAYNREYLRMTSVESATGLEAGVVFLLGMERLVSNVTLNTSSAQASEETTVTLERQARKLYMAMTRAGQSLVLLSSESLNELISGAFSKDYPYRRNH